VVVFSQGNALWRNGNKPVFNLLPMELGLHRE
jgi:hypothetical protein